jgi:hypothetical protein
MSQEIVSRAEAMALGLTHYFTGKACKNGHLSRREVAHCNCLECMREANARRVAADPEASRQRIRAWKDKNPERKRALNLAWESKNPEKARQSRRAWTARNPDVRNAKEARRRAQKLSATPAWLTPRDHGAIAAIYAEAQRLNEKTGIEHHVDHVIPLVHPAVCGLHVPWNLQIIPANDNLKKSNKFEAA